MSENVPYSNADTAMILYIHFLKEHTRNNHHTGHCNAIVSTQMAMANLMCLVILISEFRDFECLPVYQVIATKVALAASYNIKRFLPAPIYPISEQKIKSSNWLKDIG